MKIAIIGYGKMGKVIDEIAKSKGHSTVIIDPFANNADFKEISEASVKGVDVCIEFTKPDVVIENIKRLISLKQKVVVGTTGWLDKLPEIKKLCLESEAAVLYSANFSLGVNIFFKIVESAAKLINKFDNYDISGLEFHHNQKADSPSGTALSLANILLANIDRKTKAEYQMLERKIEPEELHFASIRSGSIPGTHEIIFDSEADTISLKHCARNRTGFAAGSVVAAEWLARQKGIFTFDDCMQNLLG